ncbi:MAG: hypothetical protein ACW980_01125 [Promethearchaeota archaeon]
MRKRHKINIIVLCGYLAFFAFMLIDQNTFLTDNTNHTIFNNEYENPINNVQKSLFFNNAQVNNDTTAPIITFIKPDINDTIITTSYFDIIVNVTDLNAPLPGSVSIEISQNNTSLFNASMMLNEGSEWFFFWDNISSYPNGETYVVKVRARDSSLNNNLGISDDLSILVAIYQSRSPELLNAVLYIIFVCVIFALIIVYFNRKRQSLSSVGNRVG